MKHSNVHIKKGRHEPPRVCHMTHAFVHCASCTSTAISITHHFFPGSEMVPLLIICCCFLVARSNLYHIRCTFYFLGMFDSSTSFLHFIKRGPSERLDLTWLNWMLTYAVQIKRLFTEHAYLHEHDELLLVHLQPPTEAKLLLCYFANTFNLFGLKAKTQLVYPSMCQSFLCSNVWFILAAR